MTGGGGYRQEGFGQESEVTKMSSKIKGLASTTPGPVETELPDSRSTSNALGFLQGFYCQGNVYSPQKGPRLPQPSQKSSGFFHKCPKTVSTGGGCHMGTPTQAQPRDILLQSRTTGSQTDWPEHSTPRAGSPCPPLPAGKSIQLASVTAVCDVPFTLSPNGSDRCTCFFNCDMR